MLKKIIPVFGIVLLFCCTSNSSIDSEVITNSATASNDSKLLEKSQILEDTTFLLKYINGDTNRVVFVDETIDGIDETFLMTFSIPQHEKERFKVLYSELRKEVTPRKVKMTEFTYHYREMNFLFLWKSEYYAYIPQSSRLMTQKLQISDSTVNFYDSEGPFPKIITAFEMINPIHYKFELYGKEEKELNIKSTSYSLKIISEVTGFAILTKHSKSGDVHQLMVDSDKVHKLPAIKDFWYTGYNPIIYDNFDNIDYDSLLLEFKKNEP